MHIITSLKIGGAESLLVDFLAHPSSAQATHKVIFFHDGPNRQRLIDQGILCYQVTGVVSLYDPVFFVRLYALVKLLNPDCIHTWLWSANIAGRLIGIMLRVPVLNSFHLGVDQDGFIRNVIDRCTQRLPDSLIAVSDGVAHSLITKFKVYKPERLKVIKNGVDAQEIATKSQKTLVQREALGLTADHFIIGSVGRWIERKNYPFLIEVFAQLHKRHDTARLVLLGKGPDKQALYEHAQRLGMQDYVIFIEGQPALGYYPLFDCFIQTSFKEGISIALLEAMSCSLPCILTEPSGVHEVIRHASNGLIIPAYKHELVCEEVERLINDKSLAVALGYAAQQTMIQEFGLTPMVDAYHYEYSQLIKIKSKQC